MRNFAEIVDGYSIQYQWMPQRSLNHHRLALRQLRLPHSLAIHPILLLDNNGRSNLETLSPSIPTTSMRRMKVRRSWPIKLCRSRWQDRRHSRLEMRP